MAARKKSSSKRKTKKEQMEEQAKIAAFKKETFLWIVVAVSILLFISNMGIGGHVGGTVSGFLFGVFGMVAYIFPIVLLVGTFFAVSNKDNAFAILKLISSLVFIWFICVFLYLAVYGSDAVSPAVAYSDSVRRRSGGGFIGAVFGYIFVPAFGVIGSYVIDVAVLIICIVLITGKSVMKSVKHSGKKVYESARENNERYQEYRQSRSEEKAKRRMDKKITGVSLDTKIQDPKQAKLYDDMGEIHIENYPEMPDIKEEKHTKLNTSSAKKGQDKTSDTGITETKKPLISGIIEPEPVEQKDMHEAVKPQIAGAKDMIPVSETEPLNEPPVAERTKRHTKSNQDDMQKEVANVAREIQNSNEASNNYEFPTVDLLAKAKGGSTGNTQAELMETAAKLEQTLKVFGVNAKVNNISCGPAVTRFEITPEMGVKVSKIVNLADDIKLNLAAADIRIEAPIPGKAAVGIEVPNRQSVAVSFRELVESEEFKSARSKIAFAVGKDIAGKVKVADIAKMPHLLIAGATGSGKSVCINTIIMSILYKAKPDEVKLIMIDPKVVELSVYNGIPHLMIPVVTDPKKAAGALNWAVAEMTDRYQKFAETNVREINGYNEKIDSLEVMEGQEKPKKMPQIVIIVDELADLMMVASKDVEEAICRLAQLARAAGIHLIIATQRPSVNVITGLIKANMPSRIAFAVTSGVDSRTILDMNGAEKLLGKGDMLFDPQGVPKPLRVQGAFVSDKEVSEVVNYIMEHNENADYSSDIQQKMDSMANSTGNNTVSISDIESQDDGRDAYFSEAASIITDKEKASIGMLQRYLKVGFNRAARIMDQLEEAGVVGPEEGTKPRKVLVTKEELETILANNN